MTPDNTPLTLRIGLTLLSAVMLALCFEPVGFSTLAWVALAPFLIALSGAKPTTGRALGFLLGCVFYGATLHWLFRIFGVAAIALIAMTCRRRDSRTRSLKPSGSTRIISLDCSKVRPAG